jgi:uncharacterized metal-binding protein YceD (DUF177 family)
MEAPVTQALPSQTIRFADLRNRRDTTFEISPDAGGRQAVAEALGIVGIKKLRLEGRIAPLGKADWSLEAKLGATVVQECVVTLAPVTTRIDEAVRRSYLSEMPDLGTGEVEMPEDDSAELLPDEIDLAEVMIEALALALPPFPRADGVNMGEAVYTEPGARPMTEDEAKPFSGLASLRDALENKDEGGDN